MYLIKTQDVLEMRMTMLKPLTPLKAIRQRCLDCCCQQVNEVKLCTATDCPLYAYRFGHRPAEMPMYETGMESRDLTDEQREAMRERLTKTRRKRS